MYVKSLQLADFRNYRDVAVDFGPGVTALIGANGQGKTNLVEALAFTSTLRSHRVAHDAPMVREGQQVAYVHTGVQVGARSLVIDAEIRAPGRNRFQVNGNPVSRGRDVAGLLRVAVFAPEDVQLIKGDKVARRAFLDDVLIQLSPRFAQVRTEYDRVLRQRNAALKSVAADGSSHALLEPWDEQLIGLGSDIVFARQFLCARLLPHLQAAYADLVGRDDGPALAYRTAVSPELAGAGDAAVSRAEIVAALATDIAARRSEELARGVTVVGPHRDDLEVTLRDLPAKGYASHGESWSLALGLRLAAFDLMRAEGSADAEPVLILDDVFAELDGTRRERLAAIAARAEQTIITAAVAGDVPAEMTCAVLRVHDGEVSGPSGSEAA